MTSGFNDNLQAILSELEATRVHEEELLSRLAALIEDSAADMPEHIAEVCDQAKDVFGEDAASFLGSTNRELRGQMPLRVAQEPEGAESVKDLLARISYGVYS